MLKWAIERIEGTAPAVETPIGWVPNVNSLDMGGLAAPPDDVEAAIEVDIDEWRAEIPLIEEWFTTIGDKLPTALYDELTALRHRLDRTPAP